MQLGLITEVNLRDIWKHEAQDFTKWLIKPENMKLLSDVIGIDIEDGDSEVKLSNSRYQVDILARNPISESMIIIENQLERSDHDHLGKILTYGAGYDAEVVIWICKKIREEHRTAIEWLNTHIDKNINIFVIELKVIKIGDSLPAPQFNVVVQPNDWAKTMGTYRASESEQIKIAFWQGFAEFLELKNQDIKIKGSRLRYYIDVGGKSRFRLICLLNQRSRSINVEIYIANDKELFDEVFREKDRIEGILGKELEWLRLKETGASRIKLIKKSERPVDSEKKLEHYAWLLKNIEKFQTAFKKWL